MMSIPFLIGLQSSHLEGNQPVEAEITKLDTHILIPAIFLIVVIVIIAGIAITVQKHKRI